MNNESNTPEQNASEPLKVEEHIAPEKPQVESVPSPIPGATPLPTYDTVNADAPVVTSEMIEERLARIRRTMAENTSKAGNRRPEASDSIAPRKEPSNSPDAPPRRENRGDAPRGPRPPRNNDENSSPRRSSRFAPEKKERELPYPLPDADRVPVPSLRGRDSDDIEKELEQMFQDKPLEDIMKSADAVAGQEMFSDGDKVKARVSAVLRDMVAVELGGREQGVLPLKQFPEGENPEIGTMVDVVVTRYNQDEGLYEVSLPLAAADIGDWSSITTGMIVEARVVGCNKGGLDCEVGKLRAFLPISQIDVFRIEDATAFVGQKWNCIVTEANPQRRNLVLSRRALIEQEREELREKLWGELEVGQEREGLVRKIIASGAFVDLGGLDGFIHVSAMSWGRVNHPSEVMKEGDRVKVAITKIDRESGRISLSFKDESLDPWAHVFEHYQPNDQARGRVVALTTFGAFVELMPGLEGLVHISEISYKRVTNVADVLQIGDVVEVLILAIDQEKRKMSLSIKKLGPDPRIEQQNKEDAARRDAESEAERQADAEVEATRERIRKNQPKGPLKGGLASGGDGEKFGLHW